MASLSSIGAVQNPLLSRIYNPAQLDAPKNLGAPRLDQAGATGGAAPANFGSVFDQLVSAVDAKQTEAQNITRQVLLGDNDQLHQSVIAMQEAGVAFQLMVEVRNKLVDSYQELMRMPV